MASSHLHTNTNVICISEPARASDPCRVSISGVSLGYSVASNGKSFEQKVIAFNHAEYIKKIIQECRRKLAEIEDEIESLNIKLSVKKENQDSEVARLEKIKSAISQTLKLISN
jgi:hypothetical protein